MACCRVTRLPSLAVQRDARTQSSEAGCKASRDAVSQYWRLATLPRCRSRAQPSEDSCAGIAVGVRESWVTCWRARFCRSSAKYRENCTKRLFQDEAIEWRRKLTLPPRARLGIIVRLSALVAGSVKEDTDELLPARSRVDCCGSYGRVLGKWLSRPSVRPRSEGPAIRHGGQPHGGGGDVQSADSGVRGQATRPSSDRHASGQLRPRNVSIQDPRYVHPDPCGSVS